MWPGGHHHCMNGWSGSVTSSVRKPFVPSRDLQLVQPLEVERQRALRAVDLEDEPVLAPGGEAARLDRADRAVLEAHAGLERVVDLAARLERGRHRRDRGRLAAEVAGEVDHVRAEVAERARARGLLLEPPDGGVGRAPVLQVAAAEVLDLAELARLEQLAGEPHGRDEAVVERAHVDDAGRLTRCQISYDSAASRPSGFSQTTCLPASAAATVGSAWRAFGPQLSNSSTSGSATSSRQSVTCALEPVALRGLGDRLLVAAGDRHEPRRSGGGQAM